MPPRRLTRHSEYWQRTGRFLQEAREIVGLTSEKAAERVGLSRSQLVALERGERKIDPEELKALLTLYGQAMPGQPLDIHDLLPQLTDDEREALSHLARILIAKRPLT